MTRWVILFASGFFVGITIDMVPHFVEVVAGINLCRESCPIALKGVSIAIYASIPILWGVLLAVTIGKRNSFKFLLGWVFLSFVLMLLLTWFLYAYQQG